MALVWKRQEPEIEFYTAKPGAPPPSAGGTPQPPTSSTPAVAPKPVVTPVKDAAPTAPIAPAPPVAPPTPTKPADPTKPAAPSPTTPPATPPLKIPAAPAKPALTTAPAPAPAAAAKSPSGIFGRLKTALTGRLNRTKQEIVGQIRSAIKAAGKVDANLIERVEEILIGADVGAETTMRIVEEMKEFEGRGVSGDELIDNFKKQLHDIVGHREHKLDRAGRTPYILLFVGVNGVGKTTTIGKLASEYRAQGLRVLIAAADTFRAAAVDQLKIWADRTGSEFLSKPNNSDPAGVAFDAIAKANAEGFDVVLIDTAGRLQTKTHLMEELRKIHRVADKQHPGAPHETILVLDATTGQNAISQAKVFTEVVSVSGIIMTKLDGTAKGGVLIGVRNLFDVPIVKIGVGEGIEDLQDFSPTDFVDALFEDPAA